MKFTPEINLLEMRGECSESIRSLWMARTRIMIQKSFVVYKPSFRKHATKIARVSSIVKLKAVYGVPEMCAMHQPVFSRKLSSANAGISD